MLDNHCACDATIHHYQQADMTISVIIPALNEECNVKRSVRSAWIAGATEVIVVDGGSLDHTVQSAEAAGAKVLCTSKGRAVQQNYGASQAEGDVLLFLHADNWLAPDCGLQVRQALLKPLIIAGAFRQRIDAEGWHYRLLERGNAMRARFWGVPYGDQGIFMRRDAFEEFGGFPEVTLMEDLLLMLQIRKRSKARLLPGPICVSARRWQQRGVVRQTMQNWFLITCRKIGVSPNRLARFYPTHYENHIPIEKEQHLHECSQDIHASSQCAASDR